MSQSKDHYEAARWLSTAQDDLRAARTLRDHAMHAHACFNAQQAAIQHAEFFLQAAQEILSRPNT